MTNTSQQDKHFMQLAIEQAKVAQENGDVPIDEL
jgi:tRNA(Arg) A34 adenosine deaminase TadA